MEEQRFIPEGWETTTGPLTEETIQQAYQNNKIMQGYVNKCDINYNLYVDLGNDLVGMIPREEIEAINIDTLGLPKPNICMNKVNKIVQFKVKGLREDRSVILSRREVGEEALNWAIHELTPGDTVCGIVRNIRPYGVFIEIGGGIVGLLHIEDISIARIKSPFERFSIGQKVKVMIKSIDEFSKRVVLTYKELLGSWEDNIKEFEEGCTVVGIAREKEKYKNGIFVELKPNLVGLADYREDIEYGEKVSVFIKKIIPEKKKIKLIIV